jgi:hypothetical protein
MPTFYSKIAKVSQSRSVGRHLVRGVCPTDEEQYSAITDRLDVIGGGPEAIALMGFMAASVIS